HFTSVTVTPTILEGQTATLQGTFTDPGSLDTFTLSVNWADGTPTQSVSLPAGATSFQLTHTYTQEAPVPYQINVTLTDKDGGSATANPSVQVVGFLDKLYCDVLGHTPDVAGFNAWRQLLAAGMTRTQVATAFLTSPERRGIEVNEFYLRIFGRRAD